jgi:hypothetical protein
MADTTPSRDAEPRPIGAQLIIPIAAIAFTLYYFTTILDTPWTAQVSAFFVGTILLILSVAFVAREIYAVRRGRATLGLGDLVSHADVTSGRAAIFALTIFYIYVIQWGGFTITTFFYLFICIAILNQGRPRGHRLLCHGDSVVSSVHRRLRHALSARPVRIPDAEGLLPWLKSRLSAICFCTV